MTIQWPSSSLLRNPSIIACNHDSLSWNFEIYQLQSGMLLFQVHQFLSQLLLQLCRACSSNNQGHT